MVGASDYRVMMVLDGMTPLWPDNTENVAHAKSSGWPDHVPVSTIHKMGVMFLDHNRIWPFQIWV